MEYYFDLDDEIKKVDYMLSGKRQISTIDVALVYNLCDKYIKSKLGVDILTIFEKTDNSSEDITNYLMFSLYSEPKIFNFLSKYSSFNPTNLSASFAFSFFILKFFNANSISFFTVTSKNCSSGN